MRRSAAIATCSPIWCGGCWRTAPTPRSCRSPADPAVPVAEILRRPQSWIARRGACAPSAHSAAARSLSCRSGRIRRASNSATARALEALLRRDRGAPAPNGRAAPLIDGVDAARHVARASLSPIDGETIGTVRRRRRRDRRRGDGRGAGGLCRPGTRRRSRARAAALERAGRSASRHIARALIALLQREGGKTLDDALAEVREAVDFCRYYAAQARRIAARRKRCRARPARATSCAIAAAACSSASARGISRSRSSPARSPPRSPPAMRWSPSRPSRRR